MKFYCYRWGNWSTVLSKMAISVNESDNYIIPTKAKVEVKIEKSKRISISNSKYLIFLNTYFSSFLKGGRMLGGMRDTQRGNRENWCFRLVHFNVHSWFKSQNNLPIHWHYYVKFFNTKTILKSYIQKKQVIINKKINNPYRANFSLKIYEPVCNSCAFPK